MEFDIDTSSSVNTAEIEARNEVLVNRGRVFVIGLAAFVVLMSAATIVFYAVSVGFNRLPGQAIRFALTLGLLVFLFQGKKWAQIVIAILLALGACGAVFGMAVTTRSADGSINVLAVGLLGVMAVGYGVCAALLIFSPSVARFLAHQRGQSGA